MGGDGFYACWIPPYMEPSLRGMQVGMQCLNEGLCPIGEQYQREIMAFKTNYRNLDKAQEQANILSDLIDEMGR